MDDVDIMKQVCALYAHNMMLTILCKFLAASLHTKHMFCLPVYCCQLLYSEFSVRHRNYQLLIVMPLENHYLNNDRVLH